MTDSFDHPFVYVDANPFIYFVEGDTDIAEPVRGIFELLKTRPGLGVTSELTLAEVLPKARSPIHHRNFVELIVSSKVFGLVPVDRDLLLETADYRRAASRTDIDGRRIMPKLPDAIHVVSAVRSRCRAILSNDDRLTLPPGLQRFKPDVGGIAELVEVLP
ncbi:type II toxin-antitoxin system VapC family toxin [Rhodoplanes sp. TEM]|uniref:Type II toxin-antitoxin system VapC family toxin n=1 Tax=Rhodoplanes tepidamans TaxID=200616 RepID=A0ABT5J7Y9_RHOTP|nr:MULTISPECIES: type II toxin-antitoxin system VapC family toxin [Rhodoplanes]MDC7785776.1 type II toxin-antitoxin system VapC family toxin [Rhodoplanes tepidamans]MDC7984043.1 type II toxin-antitoxin system VapC family toxin [Rhodoplanes sp. TEM]MDQ0354662.1 putative nucleic acid-binding protein [Rhodoplanes tepidamans]